MRRAAKVDDNQADIVDALRKIDGVTVRSTAMVGDGFPDICVGFRGKSFNFELKDPSKPPSKRKLTKDQQKFHKEWTGHVHVAETVKDIIDVIQ